jgi:catechol 2,3-dioxygenase-like lactoylglutathione lyase family enzyme
MRTTAAILGALAMSIGASAAAEIPANLMPKAIAGSSFNVRDLDAQKAWYLEKLGMRLLNTFSREGKPFEYIVGYGGQGGAILALLSAPNRPVGPNAMGRLILDVPDAKGLADHLQAQGVAVREVIANTAYFVTDPEGNPVELYTPPARTK